jgi:acyl-coenzyme A thioesterase PaaI-like protein
MTDDLAAGGWVHDPGEGLLAHLGGLWHRTVDGEREFCFRAEPIHANRNGVVHGGMLMTFADRAFGSTVRKAGGAPRTATISLTTEFLAPMRIGSCAVVRPRVVKITGRLGFVQGFVTSGDDVVLAAQGIWRLARQAP